MRTKKELLTGEWAVLALLCEKPAHGYAIAAMVAPGGEIGRIWSLSRPLVYRALDVLASLGLIEVQGRIADQRAPRRTEMRASAQGKRLVADWLVTPEPHVRDLRANLLLKILFLHRRHRSATPLLEAQRDQLVAQSAALATRAPEVDDDVVHLWRLTVTNAALGFVEDALARDRDKEDRA